MRRGVRGRRVDSGSLCRSLRRRRAMEALPRASRGRCAIELPVDLRRRNFRAAIGSARGPAGAKEFRSADSLRSSAGQQHDRREVGKNQHADIIAIVSRDDHVANVRREMTHDAGAQRAHAHPRAAGEFEILGEAAVEEESFVDVIWIDETHERRRRNRSRLRRKLLR